MRKFLLIIFSLILTIHVAAAKRDFYVAHEVRCGTGQMCYSLDGSPFNGKLRLYYPNGVVSQESEYRNGVKNGVEQTFYPSGEQKSYTVFSEGKIHGSASTYYKNGNIEFETPYNNGVINGTMYGYYESGRLKQEVNYEQGIKIGREKHYYPDGKPRAILTFAAGKVVSAFCWTADGQRTDYTQEAEQYHQTNTIPCRGLQIKLL